MAHQLHFDYAHNDAESTDNAEGCEPGHRPNLAPLRSRGRQLLQHNRYDAQPMTGMGQTLTDAPHKIRMRATSGPIQG
jgi:hypothetical protein